MSGGAQCISLLYHLVHVSILVIRSPGCGPFKLKCSIGASIVWTRLMKARTHSKQLISILFSLNPSGLSHPHHSLSALSLQYKIRSFAFHLLSLIRLKCLIWYLQGDPKENPLIPPEVRGI